MSEHRTPQHSPAALTLRDAAALFSKTSGRPISVEMLEADIAAGAPANPDGTLHLVHYAAWLVQELNQPTST